MERMKVLIHHVKFENLMVVKVSVLGFWVVTLCKVVGIYQCFTRTFYPEAGDIMFLQNVYIQVQILHARRPTLTQSCSPVAFYTEHPESKPEDFQDCLVH
jgi:hypothetical protein